MKPANFLKTLVYKYKLKPTSSQKEAIDRTLETLRILYNRALEERITAYQVHGVTRNAYDQAKTLITEDRKFNNDLAAVNVGVAKDCLLRLDKTYQNFFRRIKQGTEAPGFPKPKRRREYNTFTHAMLGNGCRWFGDGRVYVQNIGTMDTWYYRPLPDGARVKNLSVTRQADGYWLCVLLDVPETITEESTLPAIGIDVGYGWAFVMTSAGESFTTERFYQSSLDELAHKLRCRDSHARHSCRYREYSRQVARLHLHIKNRRQEWHIEVANALLARYGTIYYEKLSIADMVKRPDAKQDMEGNFLPNGVEATSPMRIQTLDMAWGNFFSILRQQSVKWGAQVIEVDAANTTQTCAECGEVNSVQVKLSDREFFCRHCGFREDRKRNAARVILARGLAK